MDLEAVRTFISAADRGRFHEAASELGITQQGASRRIAALERDLGVALFTRTARGVHLTVDGQAFLPHAHDLLRAAQRAEDSVRPGRRPLRVDVTHRRIAPAVMLQDFHRVHPDIPLDVVTLAANNLHDALNAVSDGTIDVTFRALTMPANQLPDGLRAERVIDHRLEVLLGPAHALAGEHEIEPGRLAGHRIWIPGIVEGTEWARFYDDLATQFNLAIDSVGPFFGDEALVEQIADSADLATIVGVGDRYLWPTRYDLRRIPLRNPVPVYPHSFVWRRDNPQPALPVLRDYFAVIRKRARTGDETWTPEWA